MGARCRGASAGEPGERGFARASYRIRGWRTAGQARDNSRLRTDGRIETAWFCVFWKRSGGYGLPSAEPKGTRDKLHVKLTRDKLHVRLKISNRNGIQQSAAGRVVPNFQCRV